MTLVDCASTSVPGSFDSGLAAIESVEDPFSDAASPTAKPTQIAFVDSQLSDLDELVSSLSDVSVYLIDAATDGAKYIAEVLGRYGSEAIDSVHIFAHGAAGTLQLGRTTLTIDSLTGYSDDIATWGDSVSGDVLLYGCEAGKGAVGKAFLTKIAALSGGDILASDDLTGYAGKGGDWDLEVAIGEIETDLAITAEGQATYEGTLRTSNSGGDSAPVITSNGGGDTAIISRPENRLFVTNNQATSDSGFREFNGFNYRLDGGADADLFSIFGGSGVLGFKEAPDFENPTDADGDNRYEVNIKVVDDNGLFDTQALTIEVRDLDDGPTAPVITSNGGGDTAIISRPENRLFVTNNQATSDSGFREFNGFNYRLAGGADADLFSIFGGSGVLGFKEAPDFENPADADGDNRYEVNIKVVDDNGLFDNQALTIEVRDLDDGPTGPVITSDGGGDTANIRLDEGISSVTDVNATSGNGDTEGNGITYRINAGEDRDRFNLDPDTGVLTFKAAPDFENPVDANGNNVYLINLLATDSDGNTDSQFLAIIVEDVDETSGSAPIITSNGGAGSAIVDVSENETAVIDLEATDADGDTEGNGLTYRINDGEDRDRFNINPNTGEISFKVAPDFETPTDSDSNNLYRINVLVTDSTGQVDSQFIQVRVTNKVSVYFLGGQSNMAGTGSDSSELTGRLANPLPAVQIWNQGVNRFVDLRPGFTSNFGSGTGFGSELGFGFALEDARAAGTSDSEEIYLAKYAFGSTDLEDDWDVQTGPTYSAFRNWVNAALNNLDSAGIDYDVEAMLWMQGENDAFNASQAANYEANLTALIDDVRSRYGEDMDFLIGRLHEELPPGFTESTVVRNAQSAVAAADPKAFLVNTDSFPVSGDRVHFSTAGHLALGEAFANRVG